VLRNIICSQGNAPGRVCRVNSKVSILLGLVLVGGVVGCGGESSSPVPDVAEAEQVVAQVQLLDPQSAQSFIEDNNPVVIDVRTQEEFDAGYIAGATLIDISSPGFTDAISALDRSATYFVYCRSGNRSATATSAMIDLGFTKVYELDGGIVAWSAAGNDIQS